MQLQYEEDRRTRTGEDIVMSLPFVKQFPFTPEWTDDHYTELMAEWNIYAPHEVPAVRNDPAEAAVVALQRELMRNVGDDVSQGVLTVQTKQPTLTAAPPGTHLQHVSPAPAATNPTDPLGVAFNIAGRDFSLPLSLPDVEALKAMAASVRNQRGDNLVRSTATTFPGPQGAVEFPTRLLVDVDLTIPMSNDPKLAATAGLVKGALATFDFPDAKQDIRQKLCPDCDDVTLVPTRLDVYDRGDCLGYTTLDKECATDDQLAGYAVVSLPIDLDYLDAAQRRAVRKDMTTCFDPDRELGTFETGEHRFYVGRTFETQNEEIPLHLIHNMKDVGFDRPNTVAVLETRAALAEYTSLEVTNAEGLRPLNYVAWSPRVIFESLPVVAPAMVTLRYKVYRGKPKTVWDIPHRDRIMAHVHAAFSFMALRPNPVTTNVQLPHDPAFLRPVNIGVILRHTYEPAAVLKAAEDPRTLLKGLDAVTYRLLTSAYECRLVPAVVYKSDCHCAAWRVQEFPHRFVFASLKGYAELRKEVGHKLSDRDCMPLLVNALENTIVNCLWAQIGNGRLLGGGGNAYDECVCETIPDCGTDWWYQNAVLVVQPEPARWARRRPLFSIRDRSTDRPKDTDDAAADPAPRSLAGALRHWNVLENIAMFL